jgi:hypothetical protein
MIPVQAFDHRLDFIDFGMNLKPNLPFAAGNLLGQTQVLLTRGVAIDRPAAKAALRRMLQKPVNQNLFQVNGRDQGQQGLCVHRHHPSIESSRDFTERFPVPPSP